MLTGAKLKQKPNVKIVLDLFENHKSRRNVDKIA